MLPQQWWRTAHMPCIRQRSLPCSSQGPSACQSACVPLQLRRVIVVRLTSAATRKKMAGKTLPRLPIPLCVHAVFHIGLDRIAVKNVPFRVLQVVQIGFCIGEFLLSIGDLLISFLLSVFRSFQPSARLFSASAISSFASAICDSALAIWSLASDSSDSEASSFA